VTNYRLGSGSGATSGTGDEGLGGGGSIMVLDETGAPISVVTNLAIPLGGNTFKLQPIDNPTSFSKYDEGVPDLATKTIKTVFHYLLSDANGCYQLVAGADANGNAVMRVEWMLSNEDYFNMTGKRLNAMSLRRLSTAVTDNTQPGFGLHHFLIANRFSGGDQVLQTFGLTAASDWTQGNISGNGSFDGEVFEINPYSFNFAAGNHGYFQDYVNSGNYLVPNNAGPTPANIVWRSPTEAVPFAKPVAPLPNPIPPSWVPGQMKRFIGSADRATSTGVLSKPSYADRPF
jgi:hypothetical protein